MLQKLKIIMIKMEKIYEYTSEFESSNIKEFGYIEYYKILIVEFKSATYSYSKVPREIFDNMKKAESKGRYFNENIKGRYEQFKC